MSETPHLWKALQMYISYNVHDSSQLILTRWNKNPVRHRLDRRLDVSRLLLHRWPGLLCKCYADRLDISTERSEIRKFTCSSLSIAWTHSKWCWWWSTGMSFLRLFKMLPRRFPSPFPISLLFPTKLYTKLITYINLTHFLACYQVLRIHCF